MKKGRKSRINAAEFKGNYVPVLRAELVTIIAAYKDRKIGRNELRAFAAGLELKVLHRRSAVDRYRIINCKSGTKGIRRLTGPSIDNATQRVGDVLSAASGAQEELSGASLKHVVVPRKFVRHIAQGRCTCAEAVTLFYYCLRRLRQVKRLQRLEPEQRYARFKYRDLESLSGITRANICRAVARLRARGFIDTREVAKQNENLYGQLFVDGHLVSLTLASPKAKSRQHKTTTAPRRNDNAPQEISTTLRNRDPKRVIQEQEFARSGDAGWTRDAEVLRIIARARAMEAEQLAQAA